MRRAVGAKGLSDRLLSQLIRSRGACEHCGTVAHLQTAHIWSRRFSAIRHDLDNVLCLCAACHHWATDCPVEFVRWLRTVRTDTQLRRLEQMRRRSGPVDWDTVADRLARLVEETDR